MRTPPAYAIRPRATVCRPLARISLAGLVADRVLSVAEDVLFPSKVRIVREHGPIRVRYKLVGCPDDKREAAERSHAFHASRCPVAKSIGGSIEIMTELPFA